MKYLLDTNICIYWFKGSYGIKDKISEVDIDDIFVSSITIAELLYGAYNSTKIDKNINRVKEFNVQFSCGHG